MSENVSKPDPFDPKRLRLSQDFGTMAGVKKNLRTVPTRKPSKEWWVRVHPDPDYHLQTCLLELKEEREIYLLDPDLVPDLATESTVSPRALYTTINRQGVVFLWPIRLPGPDGKLDEWNQSAMEAADLAQEKWVRVVANMNLGAYDVWETVEGVQVPEPQWPENSLQDLLRIAFKGHFIDSLDHPVLRSLMGEV